MKKVSDPVKISALENLEKIEMEVRERIMQGKPVSWKWLTREAGEPRKKRKRKLVS
jgi:hypothetical protein